MDEGRLTIPRCPQCGAETAIPIVYGVPTAESLEQVKRGERTLGGCSISADSPCWQCRACGRTFGDHEDAFRRLFPHVARTETAR